MTDTDDRLRMIAVEMAAMAQTGLAFTSDRFEEARCDRMRQLAAELHGLAVGVDPEPVHAALTTDRGYATPHVDVRGALFRDEQVLLVREASDGGWTLPGGWADPLDSPRAAVEREFAEEAGLAVRAVRLAAVWDGMLSNGHARSGVPFHIWKLFYLCEPVDPTAEPAAGHDGETTDVGYFPLGSLPELSSRRTSETQLHQLLAHHRDPALPPTSD